MITFFIVLIQAYFIFSENIPSLQKNEYVLHRKPVIDPGPYKLMSKNRDVSVNKILESVGSMWPFGVVTYYLDSNSYDNIIADRVHAAMNRLESVSCLKFNKVSEKPENISWIHITNPKKERKCTHDVKQNDGGEITSVLGYDCLKGNDILHTLLHAIGLQDEVTHPQRDSYIRVQWNNIQPEYRKLFRKHSQDNFKMLTEYDPLSIMHFHDRAFTSNGQATVIPLMSGLMIKPSQVLSQLDKMKIRLLFQHECNRRKVDDLLNSCKNAFHKRGKGSKNVPNNAQDSVDEQSDNLSKEPKGNNEALNDSAEDNAEEPNTKSEDDTNKSDDNKNKTYENINKSHKSDDDNDNSNKSDDNVNNSKKSEDDDDNDDNKKSNKSDDNITKSEADANVSKTEENKNNDTDEDDKEKSQSVEDNLIEDKTKDITRNIH